MRTCSRRSWQSFPDKSLILTEDPLKGGTAPGSLVQRLTNTGIIIARKTASTVWAIEKLFEYGRMHRQAAYHAQATDTLHEQDAFDWLLTGSRSHVWRRHIAVLPQRDEKRGINLNTFARGLYCDKFKDPAKAVWAPGDFTAHCAGLTVQQREWCADDSVAAAKPYWSANSKNNTHGIPFDINVVQRPFGLSLTMTRTECWTFDEKTVSSSRF